MTSIIAQNAKPFVIPELKEWKGSNGEFVLKEDDEQMYVISKYCLDCVPYTESSKIAWKNSYIRNWLNSYFLNTAFSAEQQEKIISAKIKTLPDYLFSGCAGLKKIELPEKITRIGDYAFQNCSILKKVIIHLMLVVDNLYLTYMLISQIEILMNSNM